MTRLISHTHYPRKYSRSFLPNDEGHVPTSFIQNCVHLQSTDLSRFNSVTSRLYPPPICLSLSRFPRTTGKSPFMTRRDPVPLHLPRSVGGRARCTRKHEDRKWIVAPSHTLHTALTPSGDQVTDQRIASFWAPPFLPSSSTSPMCAKLSRAATSTASQPRRPSQGPSISRRTRMPSNSTAVSSGSRTDTACQSS